MTAIARAEPCPVSRALLAGAGVDHDQVLDLVRRALAEDLAWGPDVTTEATIPAGAHGTASPDSGSPPRSWRRCRSSPDRAATRS
jgi:hypothetical protein